MSCRSARFASKHRANRFVLCVAAGQVEMAFAVHLRPLKLASWRDIGALQRNPLTGRDGLSDPVGVVLSKTQRAYPLNDYGGGCSHLQRWQRLCSGIFRHYRKKPSVFQLLKQPTQGQ